MYGRVLLFLCLFVVAASGKHYSSNMSVNNYNTEVNSRYLEVEVHPKLLISQSKFSGPRKFTLRYQLFAMKGVVMKIKMRTVSQIILFDTKDYFEKLVFVIWRVDCLYDRGQTWVFMH